jgi:hypothetical protein
MIIGKIAEIRDRYRVIINKGRVDGVQKNMKFYAYDEGKEIRDPDTQEVLEKVEVLKAYLKVIHVQEKISILESDETEKITTRPPSYHTFLGTLDKFAPVTREVMKSLPLPDDEHESAEGSSENENISEPDKIIKVGDLVKQV